MAGQVQSDTAQRVVLITGSSRGLGRAFAETIAADGAHVVVNSTGATDLGEQVAQGIRDSGGAASHVAGPVEASAELVQTVVERLGRIDGIVHNAGFIRDKTLRKMDDGQWQSVLDVHLTSAFRLARAAWPHFEAAGGGRLVFISSASGLYGNFGQGNYAAAKAGMHGLARSIALEGAKVNIAANCVAPYGATEMNSGHLPEEFKRVISPAFIAPLIGYLVRAACEENGSLFEASAGAFKKVRWERSRGVRLTPDDMSVDALAARWAAMNDFTDSEHPSDMRASLSAMYAPDAQ